MRADLSYTKGGVQGRVDHITKIKGVLFNPASVEEIVSGIPQLADEYELIATKKGATDLITLRIELLPGAEPDQEEVRKALSRQLRIKTNLSFKIEFLKYGSLPRPEIKINRFKDLRDKVENYDGGDGGMEL